MELSQYLEKLSHRLRRAEAQLAGRKQNEPHDIYRTPLSLGGTFASTSPDMSASSYDNPELPLPLNLQGSLSINEHMAATEMTSWPDMTGPDDIVEMNYDALAPPVSHCRPMKPIISVSGQVASFDSLYSVGLSGTPRDDAPELSAGLLQRLYDRYFEFFHPIIPMINRTRFEAEMSEGSPSIGVQALSSAIVALSASAVPEFRRFVNRFHEQCRTLLDVCERQDSDEYLASINTLQAFTVLAFFEFKQPNFARAWMTLGRAVSLAKMMKLDEVDGYANEGIGVRWGPHLYLPPPGNGVDMEERRRSFWVLYILDAFSITQTHAKSAFEKPIYAHLASSDDNIGESGRSVPNMPSIENALDPGRTFGMNLSFFAGTTVMVHVYRRYIDHMSWQLGGEHHMRPIFWDSHYSIEKLISRCRNNLLHQHIFGEKSRDPRSIALRMNLATVGILLHETALLKVEQEELPQMLAMEATSKCIYEATEIVEAVKMGQQLTGKKMEAFRQLDRHVVWPITTAFKLCLRMLARKENGDLSGHLYVLASAIKDYISPVHLPPGLFVEVEAWTTKA